MPNKKRLTKLKYLFSSTDSLPSRQFTCSKLTIETLERSVEYVQSLIYVNGIVLVPLLLPLNYFTPFSSVSIVNFEHVMVGWVAFFCSEISPNINSLILVFFSVKLTKNVQYSSSITLPKMIIRKLGVTPQINITTFYNFKKWHVTRKNLPKFINAMATYVRNCRRIFKIYNNYLDMHKMDEGIACAFLQRHRALSNQMNHTNK